MELSEWEQQMCEHTAASLLGTCEAKGWKTGLEGQMCQIQEAFSKTPRQRCLVLMW